MSPEESNTQAERQNSAGETEEQEGSGQEFTGKSAEKGAQARAEIPDVTLDVPELDIEEARLQVDNLRARISLQSELADMVRINVGVDTFLEKVELDLKGLRAQAMLKANLENVRDILGRTLESLDSNPDLIEKLAQSGTGSGEELEGVAGTVKDAFEKPQDENPEDQEDQEIQEHGEAAGTRRRKRWRDRSNRRRPEQGRGSRCGPGPGRGYGYWWTHHRPGRAASRRTRVKNF